jgi:hypothetical protein
MKNIGDFTLAFNLAESLRLLQALLTVHSCHSTLENLETLRLGKLELAELTNVYTRFGLETPVTICKEEE